jgi:predicted site-specific integrase-resolvase
MIEKKNGSATATAAPVTDLPRLAFSLRETCQLIGVSYATGVRLLQRGKLRSSTALRTKVISKTEIERFLSDTTQ